jgi:hypothetical protein
MLGQLVFSQERINEFAFEYEAISRGFYQKIKVKKGTLFFSEDRIVKKSSTLKLNNKQWNKILELVDEIKLKNLSSLKAPSEKRKFDGAAHSKLKVLYKDDLYESPSFDHGNPPLEIKGLVNYIIELSQSAK